MPDVIFPKQIKTGPTDAEKLMLTLKQAREVTAVVIKHKDLEQLPKLLQRRLLQLDGYIES